MQKPARYSRVRRARSGLPRADLPRPDNAHSPPSHSQGRKATTAERNPVLSAAPRMSTKNRHTVEERRSVGEYQHDYGSCAGTGHNK